MRNISPEKYHQIVDSLSDTQKFIINDKESKYIVVAAGPGSGKTRVLVHKLASLMLLEDAKHEQLLMLTFSRAAATEFKKRLMELIGNAANYIEIKTFHSYCFDLLGKIGCLEGVEDVIPKAVNMIEKDEVEQGRIAKSVLVIDEAQDMDANEFALVRALMRRNEDMRVIAVGDDDQNIYGFRHSDSRYMQSFITQPSSALYELTENYRSRNNIVAFTNAFAKTIKKRIKTTPISAVNMENGIVKIIRYKSENLEEPVVNNIIETYREGKACVLTFTNEEALRVCSLLNKRGIRARLIQSADSLQLYNLAEIRFFLKKIDSRLQTAVISDDIWNYAKAELNKKFSGSDCLDICNNLIAEFEKAKGFYMYKTDLIEFINESNYDDFYKDDLNAVYVSTIHKSKGREFDSVYMLLNKVAADNDEERRKLYVGMTRAKNSLYIHCNNNLFVNYNVPDVVMIKDKNIYDSPNKITLQLTHKDVVLDFFKDKKSSIFELKSGMLLDVDGDYLSAKIKDKRMRIAKFSKDCVQNITDLNEKGYMPVGAKVRLIVAWKDKENNDIAVVLADVYFKR